jgi:DNA-binding CsgD family transcriptional regulator
MESDNEQRLLSLNEEECKRLNEILVRRRREKITFDGPGRFDRNRAEPKHTLNSKSLALTIRERQVLLLIASGLHNKEIAIRLFISVETVKSHVRHILDKMEARSRAHAVSLGYRQGLLWVMKTD